MVSFTEADVSDSVYCIWFFRSDFGWQFIAYAADIQQRRAKQRVFKLPVYGDQRFLRYWPGRL